MIFRTFRPDTFQFLKSLSDAKLFSAVAKSIIGVLFSSLPVLLLEEP